MPYKLLKINSKGDETLELINILETIVIINPKVKKYPFAIVSLDGSSNEIFKGFFIDFLKKVNDDGVIITFEDIKEKFKEIFQVYDLLLLIDNNVKLFKKYSNQEENIMYENVYITIAYFDGGFWEISSVDESLIDLLEKQSSILD